MTPQERIDVVAMLIACAIVLSGVLIAILLGVRGLNRRVARLEAQPEVPPPFDPYRNAPQTPAANPTAQAPLYYLLSVFFWPAAFIVGIHFLRERKTARMGATCVKIGFGVIGGTVSLLTCLTMSVITVVMRDRQVTSAAPPHASATSTSTTAAKPPATHSQESLETVRGTLHEPVVLQSETITVHDLDAAFVPKIVEPGSSYVSLDVSVRNTSTKTFYAGASLRLFDTEGHTFTPAYSNGKEPMFHSVPLSPDATVRGWVTFKLPKGSTPGRLQYSAAGTELRVVEVSLVP